MSCTAVDKYSSGHHSFGNVRGVHVIQAKHRSTSVADRPKDCFLGMDSSSPDYFLRAKKAAEYLKQIRHSEVCKGSCGAAVCLQTWKLMVHITSSCSHAKNCPVPGCDTTTKLINHSKSCQTSHSGPSFCMICTLASGKDVSLAALASNPGVKKRSLSLSAVPGNENSPKHSVSRREMRMSITDLDYCEESPLAYKKSINRIPFQNTVVGLTPISARCSDFSDNP